MIAVDTNIFVYAHRADSQWHRPARQKLLTLMSSGSAWGTLWQCLREFYRVVTDGRIYKTPSPSEAAFAAVQHWVECTSFSVLKEGPSHLELLLRLAQDARASGAMIHDMSVAAICIENQVAELWTADRDFSRVAGLNAVNPLLG